MKQLNAYRIYELGARLHALIGCADKRVSDMFAPLSDAQTMLDSFIKGDVVALSTAKADAVKLLNKIGSLFNLYFIDPSTRQLKTDSNEDCIDSHELAILAAMVEKFEHALAAELNRAPTYVAGKRGIYSTYDLAENAQDIFSETLRAFIPVAAQNEFAASGRALAFDMSTACVMHALRAVEVMLRHYYELFAGAAPVKSERTYAAYLKKLAAMADEDDRENRPDKRVIQMLAQVKEHYRNPLMTAETISSIDEATQMFAMASTLIVLMAEAVARSRRSSGSEKTAALTDSSDDDGMYDFRIREAV